MKTRQQMVERKAELRAQAEQLRADARTDIARMRTELLAAVICTLREKLESREMSDDALVELYLALR